MPQNLIFFSYSLNNLFMLLVTILLLLYHTLLFFVNHFEQKFFFISSLSHRDRLCALLVTPYKKTIFYSSTLSAQHNSYPSIFFFTTLPTYPFAYFTLFFFIIYYNPDTNTSSSINSSTHSLTSLFPYYFIILPTNSGQTNLSSLLDQQAYQLTNTLLFANSLDTHTLKIDSTLISLS